MANILDHVAGRGGSGNKRLFRDQGDGSYTEDFSALAYGWDASTLSWVKLAVDANGNLVQGGSGKTLKSAKFSLSATGTVIAAVTAKRLKVYAVKLIVTAAITVKFRDGASTDLEDAQSLAANGGFVEALNPPAFLFGTAAGNSLDLVIAGTGTAAGRVSYWDDDAT